MDPKNAEAHLNLGKTQLTLGHVNEAIPELQEALRLDPGNTPGQAASEPGVSPSGRRKECGEICGMPPRNRLLRSSTNDLIGDFFVPEWQLPHDGTRKGAMISSLRFRSREVTA